MTQRQLRSEIFPGAVMLCLSGVRGKYDKFLQANSGEIRFNIKSWLCVTCAELGFYKFVDPSFKKSRLRSANLYYGGKI